MKFIWLYSQHAVSQKTVPAHFRHHACSQIIHVKMCCPVLSRKIFLRADAVIPVSTISRCSNIALCNIGDKARVILHQFLNNSLIKFSCTIAGAMSKACAFFQM